jgi:hypothetical protein
MKWLMWLPGLKKPNAQIVFNTMGMIGDQPELLAYDKKHKIGELIPIALEHEDYTLTQLMEIYQCPGEKKV